MPVATPDIAPESPPAKKDRGVTVYIPQAELKPLDETAAAKRINRSYAVREAVKQWLQKEGKIKP
jgi:metal-responsive CopG/Arc/MetJ family transcriptional regulator